MKRITESVSEADQKLVSYALFGYYEEIKNKGKGTILDIEKLELISYDNFNNWFSTNKEQFETIWASIHTCLKKRVAALLCKLRTAPSNEQQGFLFGVSSRTISNYMNLARKDLRGD